MKKQYVKRKMLEAQEKMSKGEITPYFEDFVDIKEDSSKKKKETEEDRIRKKIINQQRVKKKEEQLNENKVLLYKFIPKI